MRLIAATLRNYRMHHDVTVRFDPSRTVVGGPNESGKSTLVEAIHRALFFRHKSDVGLDKIRPRGLSAAPEVILEFERGGRAYTLRKVFNGPRGSSATLTDDAGARLDGDDAEQRLHSLLAVEQLPAAGMRRLLEQWSHLWVWQGSAADDPTSADVLNAAAGDLRKRLGAIVGDDVMESRRDTATHARVVAAHAQTYTASGNAKANSELDKAEKQFAAARQAAADAAAQLQALEHAADTVAREEETIRGHRATLESAAAEFETVERTLAEIVGLEAALTRDQEAAAAAARDYDALAAGDAQIRDVDLALAGRRASLAPREDEVARLIEHERRAQSEATRAAAAVAGTTTSQQEAVATRSLLDAVARAFDLGESRDALERKRTRFDELEAEVARLDARLRELPGIDDATIDELAAVDHDLDVARSTLQAISTRIELLHAGAAVTIDGRPLTAAAEATLTVPADLTVGDGTTLRITPGGGQSLADVRISIATLESDLRSRLARLGVPTIGAAREAHAERIALAAVREQRSAALETVDGADARAGLRDVLAELESVEAGISRRAPTGFERPSDRAALIAIRETVDDRYEAAVKAAGEAQAALDDAGRAVIEARQRRERAESDVAAARVEVTNLEVEKRILEDIHGTDREAELQRRAALKRRTLEAAAETGRVLAALAPQQVRADAERLARTLDVTRTQMTEARVRQATARGPLGATGTLDLHEAKALADARRELAEQRHAEIERRARALDLLRNLFDARRQALAETFTRPLRAKVAEYLDALFGSGSRVDVTMNATNLGGLTVARTAAGNLPFTFEELSGGTREQVAAACRLAMAEILAGGVAAEASGAPCLPIVFDDAFVNSDPHRLRAVQRVLDLGARRGLQIIVLSCTPHDYGLLGAASIHLPAASHTAAEGMVADGAAGGPGADRSD